MTKPTHVEPIVQKYVLVFDFCSSTSILENLKDYEPRSWWNLLAEVELFLKAEQRKGSFDIYKFIGDGWILVFDADFSLVDLFGFMVKLNQKYNELLETFVTPLLTGYISPIGITFGLDKGNLIHSKMGDGFEYVGRAINVASRMQAAIKTEDDNPQGKLLTSRPVFNSGDDSLAKAYRARPVVVELRNISGGDQYRAVLLSLFERPYDGPERWKATDLRLDNRFLPLDTDPLLDCTFHIDFSIDHDHGDPTHWFGVRLRGRGEADHIFDGCLVYLRSNGNLDVAILGKIVELGQVVESPMNVKMSISILGNQLTVSINGTPRGVLSTDGLLRSGKVYLHAAKTKVTIKSAQLLSEETI